MYNNLKKIDLLIQTCYKKNMPDLNQLKKMSRKELIDLLNTAEHI